MFSRTRVWVVQCAVCVCIDFIFDTGSIDLIVFS